MHFLSIKKILNFTGGILKSLSNYPQQISFFFNFNFFNKKKTNKYKLCHVLPSTCLFNIFVFLLLALFFFHLLKHPLHLPYITLFQSHQKVCQ